MKIVVRYLRLSKAFLDLAAIRKALDEREAICEHRLAELTEAFNEHHARRKALDAKCDELANAYRIARKGCVLTDAQKVELEAIDVILESFIRTPATEGES